MTTFAKGDYVRKKSGSWWEGYVVGHYSTEQTPDGVCVQLAVKNGPVQIYPASAMEKANIGAIMLIGDRSALQAKEGER